MLHYRFWFASVILFTEDWFTKNKLLQWQIRKLLFNIKYIETKNISFINVNWEKNTYKFRVNLHQQSIPWTYKTWELTRPSWRSIAKAIIPAWIKYWPRLLHEYFSPNAVMGGCAECLETEGWGWEGRGLKENCPCAPLCNVS